MRVSNEIFYDGYFWTVQNPENQKAGKLIIKDGGHASLEIMGIFEDSNEEINHILNGGNRSYLINGRIEKLGFVTLDKCFYTNYSLPMGQIAKSKLHVDHAYIGIHFTSDEEIKFTQARISIEGIDEWISMTGIHVENDFANRTASISYQNLSLDSIELNNGMTLTIGFEWSSPGFPIITEAKISQNAFFIIKSKSPRPLHDFQSIAHDLTTFLCFAIDKPVTMKYFSCQHKDITREIGDGKKLPVNIDIYYPSLPFVEEPSKIEIHNMLFRFPEIKDELQKYINNWIGSYDVIRPSMNLYFTAQSGGYKYLNNKFSAYAQALESYHRREFGGSFLEDEEYEMLKKHLIDNCPETHREWLGRKLAFGNELSFSQRLKALIKPFYQLYGNSDDRNHLIRDIIQTRNFYTHFDVSLEEEASRNLKLYILSNRMEALLQLHFLLLLDFPREKIDEIYENNRNLKYKVTGNE